MTPPHRLKLVKIGIPITGRVSSNASDLDIDQIVPLRAAHNSGRHVWWNDQRVHCQIPHDSGSHISPRQSSCFRLVGEYAFEADKWEISPQLYVDFVGDEHTFVLGVIIGRGF